MVLTEVFKEFAIPLDNEPTFFAWNFNMMYINNINFYWYNRRWITLYDFNRLSLETKAATKKATIDGAINSRPVSGPEPIGTHVDV